MCLRVGVGIGMAESSAAWRLVRKWLESRVQSARLDQAAADRQGYEARDDYDKAAAEESACRALLATDDMADQAGFAKRIKELVAQDDWGSFAELLIYKAERAGGSVIRVDPRNTSNECSRCHAITPSKICDLFSCRKCGLAMDRDHKAALVIKQRGVVAPIAKAA